jgi:hypothetical protein
LYHAVGQDCDAVASALASAERVSANALEPTEIRRAAITVKKTAILIERITNTLSVAHASY